MSEYRRLSSESEIGLFSGNRNLNTWHWWREVQQGHIGDCTFIAALNNIGKKPELVRSMFVDQTEENKAGIYTVRLYIRGKPWLINIDDSIMYSSKENGPWYARMDNKYKAYWGVLAEKAWAKAFGNYSMLKGGGFTTQAKRALVGAPVYYLPLKRLAWSPFKLYSYYFQAIKNWGFLISAGTNPSIDGEGDDHVNECGITYQHAYSVVDLIQLFQNGGDTGVVVANLYMIKDPRGYFAISNYNGAYNTNDTVNWTPAQRARIQKLYGFDPTDWSFKEQTGLFFMTDDKFTTCFQAVDEIHDRT